MPCGQLTKVNQSYLGICYWKIQYPCFKWCTYKITYSCGIKWCGFWPCGFKWCTSNITLPCIKLCNGSIPYPCIKHRMVDKYCYDFSSIGLSCKVFVEFLYGCCGGKEYSWTNICLGWVSAFVTGRRVCFDSPLESIGSCRELYSIPAGGIIPGGPIDPGSVSIGGGLSSSSSPLSKLGTCKTCIRSSFIGFIFFLTLAILGEIFLPSNLWWLNLIAYVITGLFLILRLSHFFASLAIKKQRTKT